LLLYTTDGTYTVLWFMHDWTHAKKLKISLRLASRFTSHESNIIAPEEPNMFC
jgi:hypothetical protein